MRICVLHGNELVWSVLFAKGSKNHGLAFLLSAESNGGSHSLVWQFTSCVYHNNIIYMIML